MNSLITWTKNVFTSKAAIHKYLHTPVGPKHTQFWGRYCNAWVQSQIVVGCTNWQSLLDTFPTIEQRETAISLFHLHIWQVDHVSGEGETERDRERQRETEHATTLLLPPGMWAHYLEHVNSLTSACGIPLDVSTSSVSIGAAITLSWKVGKGKINTTKWSRSSSNTNEGRGGRTLLTYRRGKNNSNQSIRYERRLSRGWARWQE